MSCSARSRTILGENLLPGTSGSLKDTHTGAVVENTGISWRCEGTDTRLFSPAGSTHHPLVTISLTDPPVRCEHEVRGDCLSSASHVPRAGGALVRVDRTRSRGLIRGCVQLPSAVERPPVCLCPQGKGPMVMWQVFLLCRPQLSPLGQPEGGLGRGADKNPRRGHPSGSNSSIRARLKPTPLLLLTLKRHRYGSRALFLSRFLTRGVI